MTKNQFLTDAEEYLGRIHGNTAQSTFDEKRRKLMYYSKILYNLQQQKVISTCNPRKITADDIHAYVTYRRSMGTKDTTIRKDLALIAGLMDYLGNNEMRVYRSIYINKKPKSYTGRLDPLPDSTIDKVYALARTTKSWRILEGCVAIILGCAAGLRPQESKMLSVDSVNYEGDCPSVHVIHVKGEDKWGRERTVPMNDGVGDIFEKYFDMRRKILARRGTVDTGLVFPPKNGRKYVTQQSMSKYKGAVFKALKDEGVAEFSLRDGRRAYGQRMLDRGVPIEYVSHCMGHDSVETTQKYYANYKDRYVLKQVNGILGNVDGRQVAW
ncbi:MAG: site-specific integrase [Methanomassiliicoccales archaeon]|nr:site-specific integrase [Methanomassiliicoccales archaeon]MDD7479080.1 site-specific integrase [Methanomassiliicoccales archaeon]